METFRHVPSFAGVQRLYYKIYPRVEEVLSRTGIPEELLFIIYKISFLFTILTLFIQHVFLSNILRLWKLHTKKATRCRFFCIVKILGIFRRLIRITSVFYLRSSALDSNHTKRRDDTVTVCARQHDVFCMIKYLITVIFIDNNSVCLSAECIAEKLYPYTIIHTRIET